MTDYLYEVKIPKDRIAVVIGKNGEIKKQIEECTHCSLNIDSAEGDVIISGEDSISLFTTREIIRAIGRGFNPEIAMLLLKQEYSFEVINLRDFADPKQLPRLKGRVIGSEGKARRVIEEHTETSISVYGKTIGIIGEADSVVLAKRAIVSLLTGSNHANVFRWLERNRAELKKRQMLGI